MGTTLRTVMFLTALTVEISPPQYSEPPAYAGTSKGVTKNFDQNCDCTGMPGCECWKTKYVCPQDGQGGCRCGVTSKVVSPSNVLTPSTSLQPTFTVYPTMQPQQSLTGQGCYTDPRTGQQVCPYNTPQVQQRRGLFR